VQHEWRCWFTLVQCGSSVTQFSCKSRWVRRPKPGLAGFCRRWFKPRFKPVRQKQVLPVSANGKNKLSYSECVYLHIENIISEYSEQSKYNSQCKYSEIFTIHPSISLWLLQTIQSLYSDTTQSTISVRNCLKLQYTNNTLFCFSSYNSLTVIVQIAPIVLLIINFASDVHKHVWILGS